MSAAPQTAPSAPRQPSSKQQTARGSKEKQQQQTHPKPSAPPVAPAPSKEKENLTAEARRGRHSLPATASANTTVNGPESKKVARRSSKPIFDWFQRKLAGTVRARRASESARSGRAHGATTSASTRDKKRPPLPNDFHALTRTHSTPSRNRSSGDRNVRRLSHAVENPNSLPIPGAVSLNDDDDDDDFGEERARENSTYRSSLAHDSLWAPTSNLEADEDASVRPLPPSSPPSPSPSRSSSSYLSDPRTFRSLAASTKPTTLLSVDLANGMAHIAQAPSTPSSTFQRMGSHTRSGGGNGGGNGGGGSISSAAAPISFSVLPVGHSPSTSVSGEPSPAHHRQTHATSSTQPVQAPQLTHYHPRNNPRPSSPPLDNASVLTLASSAFGIPGARPGIVASADAMSVSQFSHFGGSRAALHEGDRASGVGVLLGDEFVFEAGADRDRDRDRDVDASVRALRPRSSRRGSWESEASGWSAKMGPAGGSTVAIGPDTPGHDRSLFWAASVRTGEFDDAEESVAAGSVGAEPSSLGEDLPSTEPLLNGVAQEVEVEVDDGSLADSSAQQTPRKDILVEGESDEDDEREQEKETTSIRDAATPRYAPVELAAVESPPALPSSISSDSADTAATVEPLKPFEERVVRADDASDGYLGAGARQGQNAEVRSLAPSESTDVFVSAPSTPLPSLPVTPAAA